MLFIIGIAISRFQHRFLTTAEFRRWEQNQINETCNTFLSLFAN